MYFRKVTPAKFYKIYYQIIISISFIFVAPAKCVDLRLSDVSSRKVMEENGWRFKHIGQTVSRAGVRDDKCGSGSWYGWKNYDANEAGSLSVTFVESGSGTLTFGNCWGQDTVDVYFDGEKISSAKVNELEQKASFEFKEKNTLELRTEGKGIMKINSLEISCSGILFEIIIMNVTGEICNIHKTLLLV